MEWLKITTTNELVRVAVDEIVYIIADGNYCDLQLANGTVHKLTFQLHYFDDYFKKLEKNVFTRVGRSLIVNKSHIRLINVTDRIIKFGGHTVSTDIPSLRLKSLGRDSLKALKNEMAEYE